MALAPTLKPTLDLHRVEAPWTQFKFASQLMKEGKCPNITEDGRWCCQQTHEVSKIPFKKPKPLNIQGRVENGTCLVCQRRGQAHTAQNNDNDQQNVSDDYNLGMFDRLLRELPDGSRAREASTSHNRYDEYYGEVEKDYGRSQSNDGATYDLASLLAATFLLSAEKPWWGEAPYDGFEPPAEELGGYRAPLHVLCLEAGVYEKRGWSDVLAWMVVNEELARENCLTPDGEKRTMPLHIACQSSAPLQFILILLAVSPVAIMLADTDGDCPIHYAAYNHNGTDVTEVCKLLAEVYGDALTKGGQLGRTPLHWAILSEFGPRPKELVRLLSGKDRSIVNMADDNGCLPLDYARAYQARDDILELLKPFYHCMHCPGRPGICECTSGCPDCTYSLCTIVHADIICNGCGHQGVNGLRYRCTECFNYDLCQKCYNAGEHDACHSFEVFERVGSVPQQLPPRQPPIQRNSYQLGHRLRLVGLNRRDLNGLTVIVTSNQMASRRLRVRFLDSDTEISVKPENLEAVFCVGRKVRLRRLAARKELNGLVAIVEGVLDGGRVDVRLIDSGTRFRVRKENLEDIPVRNIV